MRASKRKPNPPTNDTSLLIERATAGDRDAFGELYSRFEHVVERVARSYMRGSTEVDIEDVVSETWCAVLERIEYFEPTGEDSFEKWLAAWARGRALDHHRRSEQMSPRPGADLASTQLADERLGVDDVVIAAEDAAETRKLAARTMISIQELPARQAAAVSWRELNRARIKDIAEELSITVGAAAALRYRGMRSLRASMSEAVAS